MTLPSKPTRVTLVHNNNHSLKCPLLVPAATTTSAIRDLILRTAASKLRLKKPTRIYTSLTGQEVTSDGDWEAVLEDDAELVISAAGDEFSGVKKEVIVHSDANPKCPVYILAQEAPVDQLAIKQLQTTATTLPGMVSATAQPDLCPGNKYPVGACFVSKGWIHPPLIGSDIGCGMSWYRTTLSRGQVDGVKGKKIAEKLRGVEGVWRTREEREAWLRDDEGDCNAGGEWDNAVGTIGAGNHFAEVQVVEKGVEGLPENQVVLLVHSGSRGYGGDILKRYTTDSHASLRDGSEEMGKYMEEHNRALRWARANRDLIALRFLACLEPGEESWKSGRNAPNEDAAEGLGFIETAKASVRERKLVDIWHNNLEAVKWPPSACRENGTNAFTETKTIDSSVASDTELKTKMPDTAIDQDERKEDYVYIHRKGAAPTYDAVGCKPLSFVPLPGSRGTPTLIIKPVFSAETGFGLKNALSLAHGSGRSMSRGKALSSLSSKYKHQSKSLLEPGSGDGTWVICDEKELVYEEAPEAYKDVHAVSKDLTQEGVAAVIGMCTPRVSYKIRNEAR